MSAFSAGISGLTIRVYGNNTKSLFGSLERLSSGLKINRGADNPAGLISSENLRSVLAALEAEIDTLQRSDARASVADAGLDATSSLLTDAQTLIVANAGNTLSDTEKQANQLALDSILSTIDRVSKSTAFAGDPLLDGTAQIGAVTATLDVGSISTTDLGKVTSGLTTYSLNDLRGGGSANIQTGDLTIAQKVVDQAITDVSKERARIGSFQKNTIRSGISSRQIAVENVSAAESLIRNTDYAAEIASLRVAQLMLESSALTINAVNKATGSVLKLFG